MGAFQAHFQDALHDLDVTVQNSGGTLTFSVGGFMFEGTSFGAFTLADPACADEAQKQFCITKWGGESKLGRRTLTFPYSYELQRYRMDVEIPLTVIRSADGQALNGRLLVGAELKAHNPAARQSIITCDGERVFLDDMLCTRFQLDTDGKSFAAEKKNLWFEASLLQIIRKMAPDYQLKCCFTCQFSDYSPYGSDDFGTMLCYRNHKEEYCKVHDKNSYFQYLEGLSFDTRQETALCEDYEPRIHCEGYRGYLK